MDDNSTLGKATLEVLVLFFFCGKTDFGHCLAIKNLHLPQSRFQVVRFAVFYYSRCKISASEVKAYAESQIPFAFLDSFFFFCGTFIKLHFGGIRFWEGINYFNIVRFNGIKCRWVVKQRWIFFFAFSSILDSIEPILAWFDRTFLVEQARWQRCHWWCHRRCKGRWSARAVTDATVQRRMG